MPQKIQRITSTDSITLTSAYMKDIRRYPLISREEEIELVTKIRQGDKRAKDKLVTSNLRFVITVAKQYQYKGLELADLISAGNIGLIEAVDKYEPTKCFRFINYAAWWIRHSIFQALTEQSRTIRIPFSRADTLNRIKKGINAFMKENEREPTIDELLPYVDVEKDTLQSILQAYAKKLSLDVSFDEEDGNTLVDILPNHNSPKADDNLKIEESKRVIHSMLNCLTDREHDIVCMLHGIDMFQTSSDFASRKFGICDERIRQIEKSAMKKLRERYNNSKYKENA